MIYTQFGIIDDIKEAQQYSYNPEKYHNTDRIPSGFLRYRTF